jgi:hypothetical protein
MFEWPNLMSAWDDFSANVQALAESNFGTAVVGSLAGAFGGAWAAQRIAERSKIREDLIKEIRNTNAAAGMIYGIANSYLGLKRQFVQRLKDHYEEQKERLELFQKAKRSGTVPPQQQFDLDADLQSLKPVYSPLEPLHELLFTHISLSGAELFVVPLLFSSIQYATEAISDRNRLVESWRADRPNNLVEFYYLTMALSTDGTKQPCKQSIRKPTT